MYSLPQSYNQTSKCKRCISSNAYKCTVSGTYKGNVRTATQTIQLEAAKWYKLNIKTSASGRIDMGISVDDTVEEKPQDVEVNPYL